VSAGESVVPASELAAARAEIAKLQRILGKKTLENEILKEAVEIATEKKWIARSPLLPKDEQWRPSATRWASRALTRTRGCTVARIGAMRACTARRCRTTNCWPRSVCRSPISPAMARVEITSPDLAATVTVPFEVRARLAKYWLAIVASVGVFLGWYFRYYLAGRQQIAAARVEADDALNAFRSAFSAASDKTFRVSLNAAAEKVRDALEKNDAKAIAAAVKEAQDAVTKAAADLETRLSPSATAVQAIRAVLLPAWRLPTTIGSALNSARQELRNIEATIGGAER
jgi:hypothetical protein